MAIAVNILTAGSSTVDGPTFTTASISPSPNALVLACVQVVGDFVPATVPQLTGCGLTWVDAVDILDTQTPVIFRAMGASPTTGQVAIDHPSDVPYEAAAWIIFELTGVDTSGTDGSGAIAQTNTGFDFGPGGTVPLPNPPAGTSATVAMFGRDLNEEQGTRPFWTEAGDVGYDNPAGAIEVQYRLNGGEQTAQSSAATASLAYSLIIEVLAGAASGVGSATGTHSWAGTTEGGHPGPTNLQAVAASSSQIDLTWDALSEATAYDIERDGVVIASDHASTSYSDTGLDVDTDYTYRVRGVWFV